MLTQCPHCEAIFRVYPRQLRPARGQVRCGECRECFNALDRLAEEVETAVRASEPAPARSVKPGSARPGRSRASQAAADFHQNVNVDDVPLELVDDLRALSRRQDRQAAPVRRWPWVGAAVALGLLLAAQVVWQNRIQLLEAGPVWRDTLYGICRVLGCEIAPAGDASAIELVSRDVRDHPRYVDALLINAAIVNRSDAARAFPLIELKLLDIDGRVTSIRRFLPEEYLDSSIDRDAGLPPERPVIVILEVFAPNDAEVGFEFDFVADVR